MTVKILDNYSFFDAHWHKPLRSIRHIRYSFSNVSYLFPNDLNGSQRFHVVDWLRNGVGVNRYTHWVYILNHKPFKRPLVTTPQMNVDYVIVPYEARPYWHGGKSDYERKGGARFVDRIWYFCNTQAFVLWHKRDVYHIGNLDKVERGQLLVDMLSNWPVASEHICPYADNIFREYWGLPTDETIKMLYTYTP